MGSTKKTTVPFNGTAEQEQALRSMINEHKDHNGALMPILQKAQDIYGYLPIEVQQIIADTIDVPLEELYGITTFYSQFSLNPIGKYKIGVCIGTACYVKGSGEIFEKVKEMLGVGDKETTEDGLFTVEGTRCIGCCGLAPVMTVNETVYGKITTKDVPGIIAQYK